MSSADILIVDDEADICNLIQGILEDEGYATRKAMSSKKAFEAIDEKLPSLIVQDIWLQGSDQDGLDVLKTIKKQHPEMPFVMISGHGTVETAVKAIKDGAYDFIEKPFKSDRLLMMVHRALENAKLKKENRALKQRADKDDKELIGDSTQIQNIRQIIEKAAPTNSRILIRGEPGTGKDVVAKLIHKMSLRADGPYMVLNCANLEPDRLETELFGNEADGFSGILEQAKGGTLLLDEISDMPLETQGKIVRVLQESQFLRIGGKKPIPLDVRVIATSNKDLEEAIEKNAFREDLFYRLNVVQINMPPLHERPQDIPLLAKLFLKTLLMEAKHNEKELSKPADKALQAYAWPGNVRQLKNIIEWVCIMHGASEGQCIDVEHLPPDLFTSPANSNSVDSAIQGEYLKMPLRQAREEFEKYYLLGQIQKFDGNISKTAEFIGMERSALHRKLKSLEIHAEKGQNSDDAVSAQNKKSA